MDHVRIRSRFSVPGKSLGLPFVSVIGFDSSRQKHVGLGDHAHEGYELTALFDGEVGWETAQGETLKLRGGDIAITQPGVIHRGRLNLIQPSVFFWTVFDLRRETSGLLDFGSARSLNVALRTAGNTVRYAGTTFMEELARLYEDLHGMQECQEALTRASCRARYVTILLRAASVFARADTRITDRYIADAQTYMRTRIADAELNTQDIAAHIGLSVSRLHALFKQRTGLTPVDFLQRSRIDIACGLLRTTPRPVTRIALECGFTSSQYFATCFRKYTGQTPRQFRGRKV